MKAIVVRPGEHGSIHMRDMPDPRMKPDQVAVKMLRVGLCATDAEIAHGLYGKPPDGEELPDPRSRERRRRRGRRRRCVRDSSRETWWSRPCDVPAAVCRQCKAGENDMCSSGEYTERGIMRLHGFMAQYYVESPRYLIKIPKALA